MYEMIIFAVLTTMQESAKKEPIGLQRKLSKQLIADAETPLIAKVMVRKNIESNLSVSYEMMHVDRSYALYYWWQVSTKDSKLIASRTARDRLIGQIEGVMGSRCPEIFVSILQDQSFGIDKFAESAAIKYHEIGKGWKSQSQFLKVTAEGLLYDRDGKATKLIGLNELPSFAYSVEVIKPDKSTKFYLMFPSNTPSKFDLIAIDPDAKEPLWRQKIWSSAVSYYSGPSTHCHCFPILSGKDITIYGIDIFGFFIESFDLETGKAKVRFCSYFLKSD
jgi:hypothetical protein